MSLLLAVSTPPVVVAGVQFIQASPSSVPDPGRPTALIGAVLIAGTLLAPHSSFAQPAMAPGSTTLIRGAIVPTSGTALAPHSSFGQPPLPTGAPTLLRGALLAASGTPIAAAPAAEPPPTAPSRILAGALPPAGAIRSAPILTDPPSAPPVSLLRGASLAAAGTTLAPHSSFGQPSLAQGSTTLLRGSSLPAAGRPLSATPQTEPLTSPTGSILRGATLAASGFVLAPHPSFQQPALSPGSSTAIRGAALPPAGTILATKIDPTVPPVESKLLLVSSPRVASFLLEVDPNARQPRLPAGSTELLPDPLLEDAGPVIRSPVRPTMLTTHYAGLIQGYAYTPPDPPYEGPAPIPRVGRFANVSNAAGGGGAVGWISLPGKPPELVQGNWLRDPITVEQDGTLTPGWWDQLMARSGFAGLARVEAKPITTTAPAVALGQMYLTVAQQIAARARTDQARRIAAEQALHQEIATRYALEQRVQMLTVQLDDALRHPAEESIPIVAEMPHIPLYYPEPDPAWFTSFGELEETPDPAPAPRRRLWPVVAVGAAVAAVAILFVTATSAAPPPARPKRRRRKRA